MSKTPRLGSRRHHNPVATRFEIDARSRPGHLLEQVRVALRTRHYSRRTEKCYVSWVRRYVLFHKKRHPMEMAESEISEFVSDLAVRRKVSASTQNQALSALLFLYRNVLGKELEWIDDLVRAKRPIRIPVVLSSMEVHLVLRHLEGTPLLVCRLLYGSGLRLMECMMLRVKDIDLVRNEITVRDGKGRKDRRTLLPQSLKADLERQLGISKKRHQADLPAGHGRVAIPFAMERKYPRAPWEWGWQWIFPATRPYRDPETGRSRRHHLHETVVQRSMRDAVKRSGIGKQASCHTMRHSADFVIMPPGGDLAVSFGALRPGAPTRASIIREPPGTRGADLRDGSDRV